MNKQLYPLLVAQFLSAFADNAVLFAVIAMVMQSTQLPSWYVPGLQSMFLIAFVILAPWVGRFADRHAKARVLIVGNLIKAAGAGLLLMHVEPLLAYAIIGVGAAIYSPAKYGILPELAGHEHLVKANGWIEGSTIFAILAGMVIGAKVADHSTTLALGGTIVLYSISALTTLLLPATIGKHEESANVLSAFAQHIKRFFVTPRSRFSIIGSSLFWATAATLRVILVAWAPLILLSHTASDIAQLTVFLAVGIIIGSALAPSLIPLENLARARLPAYAMAGLIIALSLSTSVWPAKILLLSIGIAGGMFIVPINAAIQEIGQQAIGSGGAVALQGFFQNAAMLVAVGIYTGSTALHIGPVQAMLTLGILLLLSAMMVSSRLPLAPQPSSPE